MLVPPAAAPPGQTSAPELDLIRMQVKAPAGGLLVTAVLTGFAWAMIGTIERRLPDGAFFVGVMIVVLIAVIIHGALMMAKLRRYEWAIAACILAIVPWSPAAGVGIPVGIWGLMTLRRKEVQAAFAIASNPNAGENLLAAHVAVPPPRVTPPPASLVVDQPPADPLSPATPNLVLGMVRSFVHSVRNYWFHTVKGRPDLPDASPSEPHASPFKSRD